MYVKVVIFSALLYLTSAKTLPSAFKICKRYEDAKCLKEAVESSLKELENGVEDFDLRPIKPLTISNLTIGEGTGPVQVVQNYKNIKIFGIPEATLDNFKKDIKDSSFEIAADAKIPLLTINAEYDFNGRLMVLPIVGKGNCTIKLIGLSASLKLLGETYNENDVKYSRIKKTSLELAPEKAEFNFEKLLSDDVQLGEKLDLNKILNENWKDVFDDVKGGYENALESIITEISNKIFMQVPYGELFPV